MHESCDSQISEILLTSMKTVPFSLSPLQYCAGWVELLTQSGCLNTSKPSVQEVQRTHVDAPAERGDTCPHDWVLVNRNDLFILKDGEIGVAYRRELEECALSTTACLSPNHCFAPTHIRADEQRRLHQGPHGEVGLSLIIGKVPVASERQVSESKASIARRVWLTLQAMMRHDQQGV